MKPKIEELFDAAMRLCVRNQNAGVNLDKWIESRRLFKEDCTKLGIVDMFDWSGLED